MEYELNGTTYTVTVPNSEVNAFARSWPGHRLDLDADYVFEFDARNGDLVDLGAMRDGVEYDGIAEDEDGAWLAALSDDACLAGADALSLHDVLAIRFQISSDYPMPA